MRRPLALIAATSLAACASFGGPAVVPPITTLAPVAEITADSLLAINALCSAEALGLDKIAPDIKLQAGMGLEAEIITGEKSLIAYLSKPIVDVVSRSFHER